MTGHLDAERISTLLDEPWSDHEGQVHLETCETCQLEFERLSRMRMALSALPDEQPPAGQWAAIEAALDAEGRAEPAIVPLRGRLVQKVMVPGPLQAAAALVLFAGGVFAGLQLTSNGDGTPAQPPTVVATGEDRALLDGLSQLESLRAPLRQAGIGTPGAQAGDGSTYPRRDPIQAAQSLVKLDGIIRAMREHLEANPDDVVASAYLLEAVEMRDRLAEELDRANGTLTW